MHYQSERTHEQIRRISQRLELATGLKVFSEEQLYTAENYQVVSVNLFRSCHLILFVNSSHYLQIVEPQCCLLPGEELRPWRKDQLA